MVWGRVGYRKAKEGEGKDGLELTRLEPPPLHHVPNHYLTRCAPFHQVFFSFSPIFFSS